MMQTIVLPCGMFLAAVALSACGTTATVAAYAYSQGSVPVPVAEAGTALEPELRRALHESHWVDDLDWSQSPQRLYEAIKTQREDLLEIRLQLGSFKSAMEQAKPWQRETNADRAKALYAVLVEQVSAFNACYFGDIARSDLVWPGESENEPAPPIQSPIATPFPKESSAQPRQDAAMPLSGDPSPTSLVLENDEDGDWFVAPAPSVAAEPRKRVMFTWSVRAKGESSRDQRLESASFNAASALRNADERGLSVLEAATDHCLEEYAHVDKLVGLLDARLARQQHTSVTIHVLNSLEVPIIVLPSAKGEGKVAFRRIEMHDGFAVHTDAPLPVAPKQYAEIAFEAVGAGATEQPLSLQLEYLAPQKNRLVRRTLLLTTPDPIAERAEEAL